MPPAAFGAPEAVGVCCRLGAGRKRNAKQFSNFIFCYFGVAMYSWSIFRISLLLGRWSSLKLSQYLPLCLLSSVISGDMKMDGLDPWQIFDVWPSGAPGQGLCVDILLSVLLTLCKITLLLPL